MSMTPDARDEHCLTLKARGLDQRLLHELRWCGNDALLADAARATDADIAGLNVAYVSKRARQAACSHDFIDEVRTFGGDVFRHCSVCGHSLE